MRERKVQIGPGAASLILIIVVLSMSVLSMLALMNARSDVRLSERSAAVSQEIYRLNSYAEETLADLDALVRHAAREAATQEAFLAAIRTDLPEDVTLADDVLTWSERSGVRQLLCAARIEWRDTVPYLRWIVHRVEVIDEERELEDKWN